MKQLVVVLSAVVPLSALAFYAYVVIPATVGGFDVIGRRAFDGTMLGLWVIIVLVAIAVGVGRARNVPWPRVLSRAAEVYAVTTLSGMLFAVLVMRTAVSTLESRDIHVTPTSEGAAGAIPEVTVIGIVVFAVVTIVARARAARAG